MTTPSRKRRGRLTCWSTSTGASTRGRSPRSSRGRGRRSKRGSRRLRTCARRLSASEPRKSPTTRSPRASNRKSPATRLPWRNWRRKSRTWTRSSTTRCGNPWAPRGSTGRAARRRKRRRRVRTRTRTTPTTTTTTFTIAPTPQRSAGGKKKRPRRTNAPPSAASPPAARTESGSRRRWRRPRRCGRSGRLSRLRLRNSRAQPRLPRNASAKTRKRPKASKRAKRTTTSTRSWTRSAPSATPKRCAGSRFRLASVNRSWKGSSDCSASRIRAESTSPGRRWPNQWPSSRRLSARRWPRPKRRLVAGPLPRLRRRKRLRRRRRSASGCARGRSRGTSRRRGSLPADRDPTMPPPRRWPRQAWARRLRRTQNCRWVYPRQRRAREARNRPRQSPLWLPRR
mmetsp:Transcript_6112/g.23569  ORF Transcript_6112/g.23569 Transcript_6112/m.23569 type:complete len:398 (-) Transcript_6112:3861-5054(-)